MPEFKLSDFPLRTSEKLRYRDMDTQGHVNNAVFSTFFEAGRVTSFYDPADPLTDPGCYFVVARITINFLGEIIWPGTVDIGTRIGSLGRSSINIEQGLFNNGACVSTAQSVVVQIDGATRRSRFLSDAMIEKLTPLLPQ